MLCLWAVGAQADLSGAQNYAAGTTDGQYMVPSGVTMVEVTAVGGQGGAGGALDGSPANRGGAGAKVIADLPVTRNQILYVEVGGNGLTAGGGGTQPNDGGAGSGGSGGGGGASDVRACKTTATVCGAGTDSLQSRLVVAGGGGGGGEEAVAADNGGAGGAAGNPPAAGQAGDGVNGGGGGQAGADNQGGGGGVAGALGGAAGNPGSYGRGGSSVLAGNGGGGGGGGYFGGGAGGSTVDATSGGGGGGAGAGSSYVTGSATNPSVATDSTDAPSVTITPIQAVPDATASSADGLTKTGATLHGSVSPNGSDTTYRFEYGKTPGYGQETAPQMASSAGGPGQAAKADLSGLAPGTTYDYRLVASNGSGTTYGDSKSFTTTAAKGPTADLGPSPLSFSGTQAPGTVSGPQSVTVTNNGDEPLNVSGASIGGTDASDFGISGSDCGSLPSGGSCHVSVRFAPQGSGSRSATLTVSSNAPPSTIGLQGSGGLPAPLVTSGPSYRLLLAFFQPQLQAVAGRRLRVTYISTLSTYTVLVIRRGGHTVARIRSFAAAGRDTVTWNGRDGSRNAGPGRYTLTLSASVGGQLDSNTITLRLVRRHKLHKRAKHR